MILAAVTLFIVFIIAWLAGIGIIISFLTNPRNFIIAALIIALIGAFLFTGLTGAIAGSLI